MKGWREPDERPPEPPPPPGDERLRELAEKGRAAQRAQDEAAAEGKQRYEDQERREREAEEKKRRHRALTKVDWLHTYWGSVLCGMALTIPATFAKVALLPQIGLHDGDGDDASFIVIWPILSIAVWLLTGLAGPRAVRAERAWVEALPFRVLGYEEAIGKSPGGFTALSLRFEGPSPDDALVADVLASDGARWKVTRDSETVLEVTRETALSGEDAETNATVVRWFHSFADVQLAGLHARHPLAEVRFL
jgi:hypothetical protein